MAQTDVGLRMRRSSLLNLGSDGGIREAAASCSRAPVEFSANGEPFRVEWRSSTSEIPLGAWQRCFAPPLEGLWLYSALEKAGLEDQFRFVYGLVMRGGEVVAIAPIFEALLPISLVAPALLDWVLSLGGRLLHHLRFQKMLFVGCPCSDEGTVGMAPGVSLGDFAGLLQQALWERTRERKAACLVWKDFPESAWPALRALSREAGLGEAVSYPGTRIADIGSDFESYLGRLTANRRHNLRKKLRLSRAHVDVTVEIVSKPDAARIEEVWRLFQNTYERATTRFERLTKKFWEVVCQQAQSRVIILRERSIGQAVAFMLVIMQGKRAINKFIGLDYGLGTKAYLYFRLWEEFIRFATQAGAEEVQSGQTAYRAKRDLGHELVPLNNFFRYRNPLIQLIALFFAKRISWSSLDDDLGRAMRSRGWNARRSG
ncbi:MAG: GNAT family N-acetyltransferase [Hyphomicrobiales bacterium]|nr:GNAT family N-acetyltransferase [Hyphomicrobiales bacterium]